MGGHPGTVEYAVTSALAELPADKRDDGAAHLALMYARHIDAATVAAKYVPMIRSMRTALDVLEGLGAGAGIRAEQHFDKICDALAAHSVLSDLGPKLLAVLAQLELTPAARRAILKGKTEGGGQGGDDGSKSLSTFDELRAKRAARG